MAKIKVTRMNFPLLFKLSQHNLIYFILTEWHFHYKNKSLKSILRSRLWPGKYNREVL